MVVNWEAAIVNFEDLTERGAEIEKYLDLKV
jgi:hypothetical protein